MFISLNDFIKMCVEEHDRIKTTKISLFQKGCHPGISCSNIFIAQKNKNVIILLNIVCMLRQLEWALKEQIYSMYIPKNKGRRQKELET